MPYTAPSRARITSCKAQSQPSTRTGWFESANCLRATEWQTARRPLRDPTHDVAGYRNPADGNARGADPSAADEHATKYFARRVGGWWIDPHRRGRRGGRAPGWQT